MKIHRVGDIVTRTGQDEHEVLLVNDPCIRVRCIKQSETYDSGFRVGDVEDNIMDNYAFVRRNHPTDPYYGEENLDNGTFYP